MPYGHLPDGRSVERYVLSNSHGVAVTLMTLGSTILSIHTPDRRGDSADIVLGFDTLDGHLGAHPYFGGTIGRYANRIANGRFNISGTTHQLACNDGLHHLHGGRTGFDRKLWSAALENDVLVMRYQSADGEEGYPGMLDAQVSYELSERNELSVKYRATCDRPTLVNLTNHAYFNLSAHDGDVLDHVFRLPGQHFLPVDGTLIPTGELRAVVGTPMDFTQPAALRERLAAPDAQLQIASGYDHTWVVEANNGPHVAAEVVEPVSGRTLLITSTQPSVQLYSGNQLNGTLTGKKGLRYAKHAGFCLEPHRFPDAPNHAHFPSARLDPGMVYEQRTVYRFGVMTAPPGCPE